MLAGHLKNSSGRMWSEGQTLSRPAFLYDYEQNRNKSYILTSNKHYTKCICDLGSTMCVKDWKLVWAKN